MFKMWNNEFNSIIVNLKYIKRNLIKNVLRIFY